ncbi:hypothetical protein VP1G_03780 [Cytospora mali]|uniref:Helicase required for RNAi-mediated heterochromatin assembly 1 n=1 Tax=Cytospora mali TaxID=578113 RepID=A0A194UXG3_CYTMA|nr:hypothetical protein VP1G_03780 [Valsa mali var. pyri (nom. inval.)]
MGQWDSFTSWEGEGSEDKNTSKELPCAYPIDPLYSFPKIEEFARRHRLGTLKEFEYESLAVRNFNRTLPKFKAWPFMVLRRCSSGADLLFFVRPSDHDAMLPKEDEVCEMDIPKYGLHLATGRENPCSYWEVEHDFWEKCLVFEVTLPYDNEVSKKFTSLIPYFSNSPSIQKADEIPDPLEKHCKVVSFQLRLSTSNRDAELGALSTLMNARQSKPTGMYNQVKAFEYTMTFKNPTKIRCLFDHFPHMRDPILKPHSVPPKLVERFQNLDAQQIEAYKHILSRIPQGVCILPGGPGAGKTHFNITVAAALLLKDERLFRGEKSPRASQNKVLFLMDINQPLTDLANKMHQLCGELNLTRQETDGSEVPRIVIRMFCWSYEKLSVRRGKLDAEREALLRGIPDGDAGKGKQPDEANSPPLQYDASCDDSASIKVPKLSGAFRKAEKPSEEWIAPTLDQVARLWYEKQKLTKYDDLRQLFEGSFSGRFDNLLNHEIEQVYKDVLRAADVLVMTPVTARKFSEYLRSFFEPTLIIFDEAPQSRELSTLIPIANFDPAAWIFTGDHRQTTPWVGSYTKVPPINQFVDQLRVSMMERAYEANPKMHSLLINHRAYGDLQRLASQLFYDGEMIPAKDPNEPDALPPSTLHLRQKYIMPLKGNAGREASRLIAIFEGIGRPEQIQKSWYHPYHRDWTMDLVSRLLRDPQFLQTNGKDPGSILIMSPYRQASQDYRKEIKELKGKCPNLEKRIVESRTVGTAQGHEADFVILDLVRDR